MPSLADIDPNSSASQKNENCCRSRSRILYYLWKEKFYNRDVVSNGKTRHLVGL